MHPINIYLRHDMPRLLLVGVKEAIRGYFRDNPILNPYHYFIGVDHANYIEMPNAMNSQEVLLGFQLIDFITAAIERINNERKVL